jgi:hypothetical protein
VPLILKRASASRPSGEWSDDDYDVLADGVVVGRIMKAAAKPADASWLWTLAYGQHEDRTPTHGYEATRETAMAAFARELATRRDLVCLLDNVGVEYRRAEKQPIRCSPKM